MKHSITHILNVVDLISTFYYLKYNSSGIEGNPLVKYLMDQLGILEALLLVKTISALLILFVFALGSITAKNIVFTIFVLLITWHIFVWGKFLW